MVVWCGVVWCDVVCADGMSAEKKNRPGKSPEHLLLVCHIPSTQSKSTIVCPQDKKDIMKYIFGSDRDILSSLCCLA